MIFYDMEVFKYDWMGYFVDTRNKKEFSIINDKEKLKEFVENNQDRIWVGFNNKHYDQYIIKGLMLDFNPWEINNKIINQKMNGWEISDLFNKIKLIQYDVFVMGRGGLKKLEGFMGHNIKETSVDFTIDRKLTDEEIKEVESYCKYDVYETVEVFYRRIDDFNNKMNLISRFKLPLSDISKTNAQLSATVLGAIQQPRNDDYDLNFPKELRINKYMDVVRWYKNPINHNQQAVLNIDINGVQHIFRWGGLHGARDNYIKEGNFVLVDVSSFYPSLMIEYDYMSRNVSNPKLFKDIYDERFRLRALGDSKQEALKLVLNTTYGCMGAKFNPLYDPLMRNNVCISGQLFLLDLLESFEDNNIKLIQTNTDGILLKYENDSELDTIKSICNEWCDRTRFNLDYEYFTKIIQKDVNNYMAIGKGDQKNVYVGDYLKDLNDLDYDLPIINTALREYFINNTPIEETINNEDRLIEFQKIVTVSYKFDGATHNGKILKEKTLRVFASKDFRDGKVERYRSINGRYQSMKFANTSDKSFIDNSDITNKKVPSKLDKGWYIDLCKKRLEQFIGMKLENLNQVSLF